MIYLNCDCFRNSPLCLLFSQYFRLKVCPCWSSRTNTGQKNNVFNQGKLIDRFEIFEPRNLRNGINGIRHVPILEAIASNAVLKTLRSKITFTCDFIQNISRIHGPHKHRNLHFFQLFMWANNAASSADKIFAIQTTSLAFKRPWSPKFDIGSTTASKTIRTIRRVNFRIIGDNEVTYPFECHLFLKLPWDSSLVFVGKWSSLRWGPKSV